MKDTQKPLDGTSFHGFTIKTSLSRLLDFFPDSIQFVDEGKINYYFCLETESGDPFSIYDWKYYREIIPEEVIEWNIGSETKEVSVEAYKKLSEIL